jgi:hypothetical protein
MMNRKFLLAATVLSFLSVQAEVAKVGVVEEIIDQVRNEIINSPDKTIGPSVIDGLGAIGAGSPPEEACQNYTTNFRSVVELAAQQSSDGKVRFDPKGVVEMIGDWLRICFPPKPDGAPYQPPVIIVNPPPVIIVNPPAPPAATSVPPTAVPPTATPIPTADPCKGLLEEAKAARLAVTEYNKQNKSCRYADKETRDECIKQRNKLETIADRLWNKYTKIC